MSTKKTKTTAVFKSVEIDELQGQLMSRINQTDLVEVEKVERYISLVKSFRKICDIIEEEGESVTTINGGQRFTKAHPLINERNKINGSLIALGKDITIYAPAQNADAPKGAAGSVDDLI